MNNDVIPYIDILISLIYNTESKLYEDKNVYVYNRKGLLKDFEIDYISFCTSSYIEPSGRKYVQKNPVSGYLFRSSISGEKQGLLCELSGYKNQLTAINLEKEFIKRAKENGYICSK